MDFCRRTLFLRKFGAPQVLTKFGLLCQETIVGPHDVFL